MIEISGTIGASNVKKIANLGLLLVLALLLTVATGCDTSEETTIVQPPDPLPAPITVTAAGECNGGTRSIQCRDSSRCAQGANPVPCASVSWSARNTTTGFDAGSRAGNPGSTVQFDGLTAGSYSVSLTATASDGRSDTRVFNTTVGASD